MADSTPSERLHQGEAPFPLRTHENECHAGFVVVTCVPISGTLTGNVFADGSAPSFVFCEPLGGDRYDCAGSGSCTTPGGREAQWSPISEVSLPCGFFGDETCS